MENAFKKIVEQIFSNWTALKLAVEHGMGGSNGNKVINECIDYITQYCISTPNIELHDVQEALEDIMDQEFDTICEDNSTNEIAYLLIHFLNLLKHGSPEQCEIEYSKLPTSQAWLTSKPTSTVQSDSSDDEIETVAPVPVENSEWTVVESKRKGNCKK